jgi:hypothetical protein
MTIRKQVDNLIEWYALNKPDATKVIVLTCSPATIRKFAIREVTQGGAYMRNGVERHRIVRGPPMYRGYKIIRATKSDPLYKAQADAFAEAVR